MVEPSFSLLTASGTRKRRNGVPLIAFRSTVILIVIFTVLYHAIMLVLVIASICFIRSVMIYMFFAEFEEVNVIIFL